MEPGLGGNAGHPGHLTVTVLVCKSQCLFKESSCFLREIYANNVVTLATVSAFRWSQYFLILHLIIIILYC